MVEKENFLLVVLAAAVEVVLAVLVMLVEVVSVVVMVELEQRLLSLDLLYFVLEVVEVLDGQVVKKELEFMEVDLEGRQEQVHPIVDKMVLLTLVAVVVAIMVVIPPLQEDQVDQVSSSLLTQPHKYSKSCR